MALKPRDTQTKIKHLILSSYLDNWAGIITSGLAGVARSQAIKGQPFRARLGYVDGFSYKGRYAGDTSDVWLNGASLLPTWGSPIIGIYGLDKAQQFAQQRHGFRIETAAILIEDFDDNFKDLRESLRLAQIEPRVVFNPAVVPPRDTAISAIKGDFLAYIDAIVSFLAEDYAKTLVLLDPYGPKGIPYTAVSRIVRQPGTDVIINLPYQDLHKKRGFLHKREAGRIADRAVLTNYDEVFGTNEWQDIVLRVEAEVSPKDSGKRVEAELASFYLERLRAADPTLVVKNIRLEFPDQSRTMFYLYLTTHDPTGALALNKVLYEAELSQYALKWDRQQAKWVHGSHQEGQLTLFDFGMDVPPPAGPQVRTPDIAKLASDIRQFLANQRASRITLRDVYAAFADSDWFAGDVDKALRRLKHERAAQFDDLRVNSPIQFDGGH